MPRQDNGIGRCRRELLNEFLIVNIGVDKVEIGPLKVLDRKTGVTVINEVRQVMTRL